MFLELCKRRNVAIRYDRYANALTASAVYNVNRSSADDPSVTAFDFVRDEKSARRREQRLEAKRYILKAIGGQPMATTRENLLEVRRKVIADLIAAGHDQAEELFDECWPHLTPTEDEELSDS